MQLDDFGLDLRAYLGAPNHLWVKSGRTTVAPLGRTVAGVEGCFAPPFAARDLRLAVHLVVDGHPVPDRGDAGKHDRGLLFAGGTWLPDRILRRGTYHYLVDGRLVSVAVTSELIPLAHAPGFLLTLRVRNRSGRSVPVHLLPVLTPGHPGVVELHQWAFVLPAAGDEALPAGPGLWRNGAVAVSLHQDVPDPVTAEDGEEVVLRVGVELAPAQGSTAARSGAAHSLAALDKQARDAWDERLASASARLPTVESDVPGLVDYYRRSLMTGLVSLWDLAGAVAQPFPAVAGMEGAGLVCYPWDTGGYAPRTLSLLLGKEASSLVQAMTAFGIERHYAFSPAGTGVGDRGYAFSVWSAVSLAWALATVHGLGRDLFPLARDLVLAQEERLPRSGNLLDFGVQKNLLEMRSAGYEHFVASPNTERAWTLERLADLADLAGEPEGEGWRSAAARIRNAVREELWDADARWFRSRYPDGHQELVYSVQAFDALRHGACTPEMVGAMLTHLREGAFLGRYGVSSVSAEDERHYELNDPDWSGGGCYTGDAPVLALTLWEQGHAELAWDVLRRLFWMGAHLPYFPQEHYADRPAVPAHKRANILGGLAGVEAILFGLGGLSPQLDGSLRIAPAPPPGSVTIRGYQHRGVSIDVNLRTDGFSVRQAGEPVFDGQYGTPCVLPPRS
jgi:hypothetical protein